MNPHRISMDDVAQAAGVSPATVCRALRNDPRITPETSKRVHAAARELGYRPDPLLSALVNRRLGRRQSDVGTLAWLMSHPTRDGGFRYRYYQGVHAGA